MGTLLGSVLYATKVWIEVGRSPEKTSAEMLFSHSSNILSSRVQSRVQSMGWVTPLIDKQTDLKLNYSECRCDRAFDIESMALKGPWNEVTIQHAPRLMHTQAFRQYIKRHVRHHRFMIDSTPVYEFDHL
jgi:hypothetical protein